MQSEKINITIFISLTTGLILLLGIILILVIYLYQQKKLIHIQSIKKLNLSHEKNLVSTQLEVQENMFRHISQEIHDNIGLTLSLVKLRLNTLEFKEVSITEEQINTSVQLLSESIDQLKNISRSLNSEVINSYGLTKAVENEIQRIKDLTGIKISLRIGGEPIYMDSQKELIIFRIIQESFNNILKHSEAKSASLFLKYNPDTLLIFIKDDGKGFNLSSIKDGSKRGSAGIKNMETRSKMIRGNMKISSSPHMGTSLHFTIPL